MPCGGYESPGIKGEGGVLVASNGGTTATNNMTGMFDNDYVEEGWGHTCCLK